MTWTTNQPSKDTKLKSLTDKIAAVIEEIEKREAERILRLYKSIEALKNHKPLVDLRETE